MTEQGPVSAPAHPTARHPHAGTNPEPRLGGILWGGLASAFLYSAVQIVRLLVPLAVISPFPLILQRLRGGLAGAVLSSALAAALLAVVFSPVVAVRFVAVIVVPGLVMGEAMAKGRGLLRGCAWAFVVISVEISLALFMASGRMSAEFMQPIERFLVDLKASGLPPETLAEVTADVTRFRDVLSVVFPAVYIIAGGLLVLVNGALVRLYLARRDPGWLEDGEFERVRFPLVLVVAFVLSGAAVVVEPLRSAAYNALLLEAFLFLLQGLAVVAFYARRLAGPSLLRAVVVGLVLVNPWSGYILAFLGLFDNWVDFRKWAEPPEARKD
jgi:uncharacterized protein YybS (DUF2232 family)